MNSSSLKLGFVSPIVKTGTIDRFWCYRSSGAGVVPTYTGRVETVSSGVPSGTLWDTNTDCTFAPSSDGVVITSLTSPVSVTKGQGLIAAVLQHSSGTIDASNYAAFFHRLAMSGAPLNVSTSARGIPYVAQTTGAWGNGTTNTVSMFGLLYDDGTPQDFMFPTTGIANVSIPTSGSGTYLGNVFTSDASFKAQTIRCTGQLSGSFRILIYDFNGIAIHDQTVSAGEYHSVQVNNTVPLSAEVQIIAGLQYRIVIKAVSGTVSLFDASFADTTYRSTVFRTWKKTSSSDASSWTDDATKTVALFPEGSIETYSSQTSVDALAEEFSSRMQSLETEVDLIISAVYDAATAHGTPTLAEVTALTSAIETKVDTVDAVADSIFTQTSASSIRSAVGLASANLDAQFDAITTDIADGVATEVLAGLSNVDPTVITFWDADVQMVHLYQGDDYKAVDGTQIDIPVNLPLINLNTAEVYYGAIHQTNKSEIRKRMSFVQVGSQWYARLEFSSGDLNGPVGDYDFDIRVKTDGDDHYITIVKGIQRLHPTHARYVAP